MRIKNNFHFSLLNFKTFKKTSIKIIISICILITCMSLAYGYKTGIVRAQKKNVQEELSKAYIITGEKLNAELETLFDCSFSQCRLYPVFESIEECSIKFENEEEKKGKDSHDYYFYRKYSKFIDEEYFSVQMDCDIINPQGAVFANCDIKKFNEEYPGEPIYLCKAEDFSKDSIMISDYILKCFGFEKSDFEKLLGQKVTFYNGDGKAFIKDARLSAVVNSNIFYTDAKNYRSQVIIGDSSKVSRPLFGGNITEDGFPFDWYYFGKTLKQTEENYYKLVDEGIEIRNTGLSMQSILIEAQANVTDSVVMIIIWIIAVTIFIGLSIAVYYKCNYFRKNHAMMYSVGCTKSDMFWIFELEMLLETAIAVGVSVLLIFGVYALLENIISVELGVELWISDFFGIPFGILIGSLLVIIFIYGALNISSFSGKRALQKLNEE